MDHASKPIETGPGLAGGDAWPASAIRHTQAPAFIRATSGEPEPHTPPPPAPGVELRVQLIAHLVARSVLDAGGDATAAERRRLRQHLGARLASMAPGLVPLSRADLDGFLAWVSRTLDDCIEAPR